MVAKSKRTSKRTSKRAPKSSTKKKIAKGAIGLVSAGALYAGAKMAQRKNNRTSSLATAERESDAIFENWLKKMEDDLKAEEENMKAEEERQERQKNIESARRVHRDRTKPKVKEEEEITWVVDEQGDIKKFDTINLDMQSSRITVKNAFLTELVWAHENGLKICDFDSWLKIEENLGAGFFGSVKGVCVPKEECKYKAVKKSSTFRQDLYRDAFLNEATILNHIWKYQAEAERKRQQGGKPELKLEHFIMLYHFMKCQRKSNSRKYHKVGILLMERFANGMTLNDAIQIPKTDEWWIGVLKQLADISDALDGMGINHNDMHANNVLVSNPNAVYNPDERVSLNKLFLKVIDFGSATAKPGVMSEQDEKNLKFTISSFLGGKDPGFQEGRDIFLLFENLLHYMPSNIQSLISRFVDNAMKEREGDVPGSSSTSMGQLLRDELTKTFKEYSRFINS